MNGRRSGLGVGDRWWWGLGALLCLAAWLAPDHYEPWLGFHSEVPMFAALSLGCVALCAPSRPLVRLPCCGVLPVAALGAVMVVQWMTGQLIYSGHLLLGLLYLAGMLMAWWLGASVVALSVSVRRSLARGAAILLCAAIASGGIVLLQWLRIDDGLSLYVLELAPGVRPSGNLAQPNLQATLLLMGTVGLAFLWAERRLGTSLAVLLLVFLAAAQVLTESRAGLLGAGCIGILVLWRASALRWRSGRHAVLLWWGLLIAFWWLREPINEALLLQPARTPGWGVDGVRLVLWQQMLSAMAQSPWWGYGWNQTAVAQKYGAATAPGEWPIDFAHNLGLDLLIWFGVPLGLLLIGLMLWWVWRCIHRLRDPIQLLVLCCALPVLTHSLVEFPFAYSFFLFPATFAFGALHALQSPGAYRTAAAPRRSLRLGLVSGLALYVAVGSVVVVDYVAAEGGWRVLRLSELGQPAGHAAPDLLLLDQLGALLDFGRTQPVAAIDADTLQRMRDAAQFHSSSALHINYVLALALNDQPQEAAHQLAILRDLYGPAAHGRAMARFAMLCGARCSSLSGAVLP